MTSVINPNIVPIINPGSLFSAFTTNNTLSVRWLAPTDPVLFSVLNRPIADVTFRQLILAKTLDNISLRLSHQSLFPFLVQPKLNNGSVITDLPLSWIWDMDVSLPKKWEKLRLAKIKRISGVNGSGTGSSSTAYTGKLSLIFTAIQTGSTVETAIFKAEYIINSALTYQIVRVAKLVTGEEPVVLSPGEIETIDGFITFRTLNTSDAVNQAFLDAVPPPVDLTVNVNGDYITPNVVPLLDSPPSNATSTSFDTLAVSHGTGLLTLSAFNPIPAVNTDISTWVNAFNYPFDSGATLQSATVSTITIPRGLFKEFNIVAPAGDNPTGDVTGNFFPVYISRIVRGDVGSTVLTVYFSTFNIESPSIVPVEFASMTLNKSGLPDTVVEIKQFKHLYPSKDGDNTWFQGFGKGHGVLSDLWGGATINDFFASFASIVSDPPEALFISATTRLSSYGISRVPQYSPTVGQAEALLGSKNGISAPSSTNRFVVEADQGLGEQVDFAVNTNLPVDKRENPDIERYGYKGSLAHRIAFLTIDAAGVNHDYDTDILPRLQILFGRSPIPSDMYFDGTSLKMFLPSGTWVTL